MLGGSLLRVSVIMCCSVWRRCRSMLMVTVSVLRRLG